MRHNSSLKYIVTACCCAGMGFLSSCRTPAYNAAMRGDAVTMQRLVQEKACLDEQNVIAIPKSDMYTLFVHLPILLTAMAWDIGTLFTLGSCSMVERVTPNTSTHWDDYPINVAVSKGYVDVVRVMLPTRPKIHPEAICAAAKNNKASVINELLKAKYITATWTHQSKSLLEWAASAGAADVTRVLVRHGADVNSTLSDGETPLFTAACNGNVADAKLLISAGADIHRVLDLAASRSEAKDKSMTIVNTLVKAGAPAKAFATHSLYGQGDSTLEILITEAGESAAEEIDDEEDGF